MNNTQNIAIIHGPNLNLLGHRENSIYGNQSLDDINNLIIKHAESHNIQVNIHQFNDEGAIISHIQEFIHKQYTGLIINPAAYTHTSIAIRDAILAVSIPTIEVHLSNIHAREEFRHHSYIAPIAIGQITGLHYHGYLMALNYFANNNIQ